LTIADFAAFLAADRSRVNFLADEGVFHASQSSQHLLQGDEAREDDCGDPGDGNGTINETSEAARTNRRSG
jgi:hypothetical protein